MPQQLKTFQLQYVASAKDCTKRAEEPERESKGLEPHRVGRSVPRRCARRTGQGRELRCASAPGRRHEPRRAAPHEFVQQFVRDFFSAGKPVAAICHGPWTLIDAGLVDGRKMTSYESIQMDLRNAGARWVNAEVVVDSGLVTSRRPDDIPAFNRRMIEEFQEAPTAGRSTQRARGTSAYWLQTKGKLFPIAKQVIS